MANPGQLPGGVFPSVAGIPGPQQQHQQRPFLSQPPTGLVTQLSSPAKEVNTASLCKIGQELVQDIVQKTQEVFQTLKVMQLPNGVTVNAQNFQDRKVKLEDLRMNLIMNFRKLRVIYNKVIENTAMFEERPVEDLLPVEEDGEVKGETPKLTEAVKYTSEEHKLYADQIRLKNHQLKDIIDQLRTIIWEINTMMVMRK
ncbi:Mediator of RNA polymerase II transcription subunit 30 [Lamellibrachia satsuma]|nr:Mediator of RNA polymerase II transcription subunit 30 [Lamellibrachia satsuma]